MIPNTNQKNKIVISIAIVITVLAFISGLGIGNVAKSVYTTTYTTTPQIITYTTTYNTYNITTTISQNNSGINTTITNNQTITITHTTTITEDTNCIGCVNDGDGDGN